MPRIVDRSRLTSLLSALVSALGSALRYPLLPRLTRTGRLAGAAAGAAMLTACASEPPPGPPPPPMGGAATPQGCAADKLADDALVGKPEAEAIALLDGCAWRIGQRDAQQFPGTMDYRPDRRTLGIAGGLVVWVKRG